MNVLYRLGRFVNLYEAGVLGSELFESIRANIVARVPIDHDNHLLDLVARYEHGGLTKAEFVEAARSIVRAAAASRLH